MQINCKEILERHSSRFFNKDKLISNEIIEKILIAASLAPSGYNRQPWRFRIITEQKLIEEIKKFMPNNKWILTCNCLIVVYLDKGSSYDFIKDSMALGAAIENMLLEACSNGVGSCWIGINKDSENISNYFNYEKNLKIMSIVALGYVKREFTRTPKKNISQLVV